MNRRTDGTKIASFYWKLHKNKMMTKIKSWQLSIESRDRDISLNSDLLRGMTWLDMFLSLLVVSCADITRYDSTSSSKSIPVPTFPHMSLLFLTCSDISGNDSTCPSKSVLLITCAYISSHVPACACIIVTCVREQMNRFLWRHCKEIPVSIQFS